MTRRFAAFGLALILGTSGCLHTATVPPEHECLCRRAVPDCSRDAVYVFFVNGFDPLDFGGLSSLRYYANGVGFRKTFYGYEYQRDGFAKQIRQVRVDDPDARVVLIGYDTGAVTAAELAWEAAQEGVPVDRLLLLGARDFGGVLAGMEQYPLAAEVLNVRGRNAVMAAPALSNVMNYDIEGSGQDALATSPMVRELLTRELIEVAAEVPILVEDLGPGIPMVTPAPPPRPAGEAPTEVPPAGWDFLVPRLMPGYEVPVAVIGE